MSRMSRQRVAGVSSTPEGMGTSSVMPTLCVAIFVIDSVDLKIKYEDMIYAGREETPVVLYLTDSFEYGEGGLATIEKAFVDTFYSVTRNGYPLALQELVRIYENLVRTGNIDRKKTVTIAGRRSIQYDIRYIVESDYITEEARRFVEIMRRER